MARADKTSEQGSPKTGKNRTFLFVSYSRRDDENLAFVESELNTLAEKGIISPFVDKQIKTGSEWRKSIDTALNSMDAAILLITNNFLNSSFVTEVELKAIRRKARSRNLLVIPIYFEKCELGKHDWILKYQSPADPKRPLNEMDEVQRAEVLAKIADQLRVFSFRNTAFARFVRRRILNWRFSLPVAIACGAFAVSAFFISWRQVQPLPVRQAVMTVPVSACAAEEVGSVAQLFENGWLLANFAEDRFYVISKTRDRGIQWVSEPASRFTKGAEDACDDVEGEVLLRRGFRWMYCRSARKADIQKMLGKPLSEEIRVWAQYQNWLGGRFIYGLPSTAQGANLGQFQVLSGVFLNKPEGSSGTGRMFGYTTGTSQESEYCTAIWHSAVAHDEFHPMQKSFMERYNCRQATTGDSYLKQQRACSLSGYLSD